MLKSCDKKSVTYIGWTKDLKNRVKQHNLGKGAKFTRGRKWNVIYYEMFKSKSKAMKREYHLKRNKKLRRKLKEIS